ncbi:MAG: UDP-N-acetylglucosamine 1-carboxyvinyltransferase, partial [Epulopiscium sp.]|nr:UDP-N-acetylglucosamine 1-carboxyvinyltransferase [Candidatus Epulonipiscium sp.]
MARLLIDQSPPLRGRVRISGAKNSVLPILAATLLADGKSYIDEIPRLQDVWIMQELLEELGAKTHCYKNSIEVCANNLTHYEAPYELVRQMRA